MPMIIGDPHWPGRGRDNPASKMNALVARGAPRDFRDVYEVVQAGLATVPECWDLWQAKNPV